jgi:hypothetical protein
MGKRFAEYYYENEELIFAFYQTHHYNLPFYATQERADEYGGEIFDPDKTVITEDRYYFNKGKMIRYNAPQKLDR